MVKIGKLDLSNILIVLNKYGITNKLEQAHFLGQADHESGGFTNFQESSRYRFFRAKQIWPNRLTQINEMQKKLKATDDSFCPQPWLFNLVYGSRMGNELNGTNDDDGFLYRGGGIGQLTGYNNYLAFTNWLKRQGTMTSATPLEIAEWIRTNEEGAIVSFVWYWNVNKIGSKARLNDVAAVTKAINGGTIGLSDRLAKTLKYRKLLGC